MQPATVLCKTHRTHSARMHAQAVHHKLSRTGCAPQIMDHGTQPSCWAALCCDSATTATSIPKLRWYQHVARQVARATQDRNGLGKRRRLEAASLDASSVCPSMVDTTDDTSGGSDSSESASVSTSSYDTESDESLLEEDNFDDLCMSGVQQDVAKRRAAIQAARRAFQQQAKRKTGRMNGLAKEESDQEDFQPPFGQVYTLPWRSCVLLSMGCMRPHKMTRLHVCLHAGSSAAC